MWTYCPVHQAVLSCPGEKGLEEDERQGEVTPTHPLCLLLTITINCGLHPPTSPPSCSLLSLLFSILSLFYFSFHKSDHSSLHCHHGNPLLCCRTPPSPLLSSPRLLPPPLYLPLSPIICRGSTVLMLMVVFCTQALLSCPPLLSSSSLFFFPLFN